MITKGLVCHSTRCVDRRELCLAASHAPGLLCGAVPAVLPTSASESLAQTSANLQQSHLAIHARRRPQARGTAKVVAGMKTAASRRANVPRCCVRCARMTPTAPAGTSEPALLDRHRRRNPLVHYAAASSVLHSAGTANTSDSDYQ
jgi:hypothetical protein